MAALLEPIVVEFLDLIDEVFLENEERNVARDPRRYLRDFKNPLEWFSDVLFRRRYRFTKDLVRHHILPLLVFEEPRSRRGLPLPPVLQLLIALRFYATGTFQVLMAHVRTRNLVERMFSVWKQRFPCLQLVLRNKLQTTAAIIVACAICHNIGIRHNDYVEEAELQANNDVPIPPVPLRPGRAMAIRNEFIIRHFN